MDTPGEFQRKTRAQFDRVRRFMRAVREEFIIESANVAVEATPGFGNQSPEDTSYIPTGRLRGGWNWTIDKQRVTSRFDGGPYSDYGVETVARIEAQVRSGVIPDRSSLENDVAYGFIVVVGGGRHAQPRNFPDEVYQRRGSIAEAAMSNAMSRARS